MAVTQTDEPGFTRTQRFASLTSSGHIHAFYVSEWLNKRLAKLCRSTEEHPVAHLTILANQETGDLLWMEIDPAMPALCSDEVIATYSLELLTSFDERRDFLSAPENRADMLCRLTVNEVEQTDFRVSVRIRGEVLREFATSAYSHCQVNHVVLRGHFNYLRRDPATHWAAEELAEVLEDL